MASIVEDKLKDPTYVEKTVLRADITYEESQTLYKTWATVGTYNNIHGDETIYGASEMFSKAMSALFSDVTSVQVLDAGAGTGLTGEQLHLLGYTNVDALEPLAEFADVCRNKGYYRSVFNQPVGMDSPVPVADGTYDAVVVVGAFGPGAIPPSAIEEFLRVVKRGGYFVNCMREEYLWTVPQYRDKFVPLLEQLERQGRVQKLEWTVYPKHFQEKTGVRMIYKVL